VREAERAAARPRLPARKHAEENVRNAACRQTRCRRPQFTAVSRAMSPPLSREKEFMAYRPRRAWSSMTVTSPAAPRHREGTYAGPLEGAKEEARSQLCERTRYSEQENV